MSDLSQPQACQTLLLVFCCLQHLELEGARPHHLSASWTVRRQSHQLSHVRHHSCFRVQLHRKSQHHHWKSHRRLNQKSFGNTLRPERHRLGLQKSRLLQQFSSVHRNGHCRHQPDEGWRKGLQRLPRTGLVKSTEAASKYSKVLQEGNRGGVF